MKIMHSIIINFDDTADINAEYNKLKMLYPKNKITRTNIEELEDEYLLTLALDREKNGSGITYTMEEVMARHGITQEDLDNAEEDEFE